MNSKQTLACMIICCLMTACGGGSGGSSSGDDSPAEPLMSLETVSIDGTADWPNATLLQVSIDGGAPITVTDGTWTSVIDMTGKTEYTAEVQLIADSEIVATREITVKK